MPVSAQYPTDSAAREDFATRAFLDDEERQLGNNVVLRPITLASLTLLKVTRSEFLSPLGPITEQTNPKTGETFTGPTIENEILAALSFGYIHSAPEKEVRRAVWTESVFREKVLEWGDRLTPEDLPRLVDEITRRLEAIAALDFGVKAKPEKDGSPGPQPPPNS